MRRKWNLPMLCFLLIFSAVSVMAEEIKLIPGITIPEPLSVDGTTHVSLATGKWGLGASKDLLRIHDLIVIRWEPLVAFQEYNISSVALCLDATKLSKKLKFLNDLTGITIGVFFGKRLDNGKEDYGLSLNIPLL